MAQEIYDIDTVGFKDGALGNFFDFYVNNAFYLLAPDYYYTFYSIYINRCLSTYDGWVNGFHNRRSGLVPQRMLQSITTGLNNMLFAHGIDFAGDKTDYDFAVKWAKKSKFLNAIKKGHKFAVAGGTSLLKVNREGKNLFVTAHRIDTFFPDFDANGNIVSVKIYYDVLHNAEDKAENTKHYGVCEERYFNEENKPCVKCSVYLVSGNLQTAVLARSKEPKNVNWAELPNAVKKQIKKYYPSAMVGKEQYLPFPDWLGCVTMKFTDSIEQIPNSPFGQPIGDILFTENFQYDQFKYFEKNEVDLARARALIPEEYWNKDDPDFADRALDERFFQKVSSISDSDKVTPIQFELRADGIRLQIENILKSCAFKLNVSASQIASFLSEGAGARTATEIISEKTKSDTWIKNQINLNAPQIDELLSYIMRYYDHYPVEIILKAEDQSPFIERLKAYSDVFSAGNMSAQRFVKLAYNNLSQSEQEEEIKYLEQTKALNDTMQQATINSWQK